jgi:putative methyltransferase (TIGR04325 family)
MNLLQSKGKKIAMSILKEVLPPFIIKMARKSLTKSNCSGTYSSYSEAALTCADYGYEQDDLIAVLLEKTKRYKNSINTSQYLEPDIQNTRLLLAICLACNPTQPNPTQVIDFGGACGAHYFFANAFFKLRNIKLQWHVVETQAMASAAKIFEDGQLHFHNTLDDMKKEIGDVNIIFASGVLQYTPDPYGILTTIVEYGAQYIFFTRLGITTEPTELVTVQTSRLSENGIGPLPDGMKDGVVKYPIVLAQKERVEEILRRNYEIQMVWKEHEAAYRWNGHSIDLYGILAEKRHQD